MADTHVPKAESPVAREKLEAQIKSADMTEDMQQESIEVAQEAMAKFTIEKVSSPSTASPEAPKLTRYGRTSHSTSSAQFVHAKPVTIDPILTECSSTSERDRPGTALLAEISVASLPTRPSTLSTFTLATAQFYYSKRNRHGRNGSPVGAFGRACCSERDGCGWTRRRQRQKQEAARQHDGC